MAQHYPIEMFHQKRIHDIGESIRKQKYFKTSMKFEQIEKNIFLTSRFVGKGLIAGTNRGTFEVHIDDKGNVGSIYLVA